MKSNKTTIRNEILAQIVLTFLIFALSSFHNATYKCIGCYVPKCSLAFNCVKSEKEGMWDCKYCETADCVIQGDVECRLDLDSRVKNCAVEECEKEEEVDEKTKKMEEFQEKIQEYKDKIKEIFTSSETYTYYIPIIILVGLKIGMYIYLFYEGIHNGDEYSLSVFVIALIQFILEIGFTIYMFWEKYFRF